MEDKLKKCFVIVWIINVAPFCIHIHDGSTQNISMFIQQVEKYVSSQFIDPDNLISYISFHKVQNNVKNKVQAEIRENFSNNITLISFNDKLVQLIFSDINELPTDNSDLLKNDFILFFTCSYVQQYLYFNASLIKAIPQESLLKIVKIFNCKMPEFDFVTPKPLINENQQITTQKIVYRLKAIPLSEIQNYTPIDCQTAQNQLHNLTSIFFQNTTRKDLLLYCPDNKSISIYPYTTHKVSTVINESIFINKKQQVNIIITQQ